ncbi:MAG TPA: CSLREA domain-containing protein, partial [Solirubrobacteraceae bacterium]
MVRGRLFALVVLLAIAASAGSAHAATITVNTTFDDQNQGDNQCSLRKAIQDVDTPGSGQTDCAPAAFGANTIVLAAGRYLLGPQFPGPGQQLTIAPTVTNLTIAGANENTTSIDAGSLNNRVFMVSSGANVTLQNVTVLNGSAPSGATGPSGAAGQAGSNGGAILNQGTLSVVNSAITNSRAGSGGNGGPAGTSGPGGDGGPGGSGGAIYNTGALTLTGATIGSDVAGTGGTGGAGAQGAPGTDGGNGGAGGTGGGIENAGGTLTVVGSTIRG